MTNALRIGGAPLMLAAASLFFGACDSEDLEGTSTAEQDRTTASAPARAEVDAPGACPVMVNDGDCDKNKRPIVFVHGTTANGESFGHQAQLFASNGYCPDRIRAVEYHSLVMTDGGAALPGVGLDGGVPAADAGASLVRTLDREETYRRASQAIDEAIAALRAETGFDKVDLMGHSQGGGHATRYTREHPENVARYVNFAGGQVAADPGGVPTLCVSSTGDRVMNCGTTKNVIFQDDTLDHAAVSSSTESFVEVFKFLNDDKAPQYDTVQCGSPILLEGRAPTFGDNTFLVGSKIEVHELGDAPRTRGEPVKVFEIGADGKFGPWEARRDVAYEFKMVPPPGDTRRPRHAYLPPFVRSDRLLRFNFESRDPAASGTGAQVRYGDDHAVMNVRRRQRAFLSGRDTLKIDGFDAVTAENARLRTVTCSLYIYDAPPGDQLSTGKSIVRSTFLDSADVFIPTATPAYVKVEFNGRTMRVPNWPSDSEGMSLVLVD